MDEHNQTTHHDPLINLLFDDGLQNALPRIAEILMNAATLLEREKHIGAAPHQRGVERNGYGNGFKPRIDRCRKVSAFFAPDFGQTGHCILPGDIAVKSDS